MPPLNVHFFAQSDVAQEVNGRPHFLVICARDGQPLPLVRADGDEDGGKPLVKQRIQVFNAGVQAQFHAQIHDFLHFPVDDGGGQPVFGHAHAQHPPGHRQRFQNSHAVTGQYQIFGGCQPAWPRANDRHPFTVRALGRFWRDVRFGVHLVGGKPLEGGDGHRFVYQIAVAGGFAAMVADTAANAGEWIIFFDDPQRFLVTPFADHGDVALRPLPGGAGVAAGGDALFLDGVSVGDGLGIQFVGCFALVQAAVKPVVHDDGADGGAVAAGGAFVNVNVAGMALDDGRKMPRLPLQLDQFAVSQNLNVVMSGRTDQPRADGTHGAVIGGEGLVQRGHVAADGRFFLDQVHLEAGIG